MRCDDDDDDDKVNKMLEKQTTTNDEESVCCTYCRTKRSQKQLQYSSHKMLNTLFANPCTHAHSIHTVHAYRCSKRARDVCIVNTNSHCFLFSRKYLCKGSSQLSLSLPRVAWVWNECSQRMFLQKNRMRKHRNKIQNRNALHNFGYNLVYMYLK